MFEATSFRGIIYKQIKMNLFIEKLKISNFLSFFGEYEVNLKPFTAVICNFYEGKNDLLRAFEFVFGAKLVDLGVENPLDLVHEVLREEFLINRDIHAYVEVVLNLMPEKKPLKFSRSIVNGPNNSRIEHKISDLITSRVLYEEKLNSLGVFTQTKNLIFYKSYFNNVIWGSAEDLEMTISTCLRENYLLEDWRKANKEVERLTRLKDLTMKKNYNSMKKSHFVLANFAKKYELFSSNRESVAEKILQEFVNDETPESTPSLSDHTEENSTQNAEEKAETILLMEGKIDFLTEELHDLNLKESVLTSRLYHEEIKLSAKPVDASILQNRISQIKSELQEKENQMSEIWKNIQATESALENISRRISLALISFHDMQCISYTQNRFTPYGRFYDYLQPSRYIQLLKQIIGENIFYAHLCDSVEDASFFLKQLRDLKYEHREIFIPFENYSHKLKDLIVASGEGGIQIDTLEKLLIFLFKLYQYQIIEEIPVIVQRQFNYETIPDDFVIYIQNGLHFESDGLVSYKGNQNDFVLETEDELRKNLAGLYTEEEIQYQKWQDLLFLRWKMLTEMNSLENDIFCLKRKWRKSTQKLNMEREPPPLTEIYDDFYAIFKEYDEQRRKYESEFRESEETFFAEGDSSGSSNEDSLNLVMKDLEVVVSEKRKIKKLLEDKISEIRLLHVTILDPHRSRKHAFLSQKNLNQKRLFFEKEFKKIKKLMKEDDLEDFLGNQEWRKAFIASLIKDLEEIKAKLNASTEKLQNIASTRKRRLYQLFDHCSRYLSSTFSHILDGALPFIKINFAAGEEKLQLLSCLGEEKINIVEIKHFNTLLKFISTLSLFLEIAKFDKTSIMILDDIEDYFPAFEDDLEAALGEEMLEKILPEKDNPRFHLIIRLGQFLRHYIKKHIPSNRVRNNGNYKDYTNGPMQIIYFVKEDFVHAAEHCVWIQNQILPEEYLTDNCNSYSEIHEINLNNIII